MKTTIDIADTLLEEAKATAERESATLSSLVEEGLRFVLAQRTEMQVPFRLRDASVDGRGLQPGIDLANREQMLALIHTNKVKGIALSTSTQQPLRRRHPLH